MKFTITHRDRLWVGANIPTSHWNRNRVGTTTHRERNRVQVRLLSTHHFCGDWSRTEWSPLEPYGAEFTGAVRSGVHWSRTEWSPLGPYGVEPTGAVRSGAVARQRASHDWRAAVSARRGARSFQSAKVGERSASAPASQRRSALWATVQSSRHRVRLARTNTDPRTSGQKLPHAQPAHRARRAGRALCAC